MAGGDRKIFQQVVGQYGGPAFARRARDVQLAFDVIVETCRRRREEWLLFVRLPLGTLYALAGSTTALEAFLDNPDRLQTLETLRDDLQPRLRLPPAPSASRRILGRALAELLGAIVRFNDHWQDFIAGLDLRSANLLRDRYNQFYVLEKECALGSSLLARQGFQRLNPLGPEDFLKILPILPVP
ncbi:MAG TPA: hypothetical protein VNX28_14550 [Gemmataceae bacterium]|jgi:hypothetical protein|nr:hypothetical protein [Gemmataceae bacterium]